MQPRIDYPRVDPGALRTLMGHYVADSGLEQSLLDLVSVCRI
jgi:hypothetical protein